MHKADKTLSGKALCGSASMIQPVGAPVTSDGIPQVGIRWSHLGGMQLKGKQYGQSQGAAGGWAGGHYIKGPDNKQTKRLGLGRNGCILY